MAIVTVTDANFESEVLKSDKPVLIDFWAAWCGPCRMVSPVVDEIAKENPHIKVGKINVDEQPSLAQKYGIMSIPTLMLFKEGRMAQTIIGVRPKDAILQMLK